MLNVMTVGMKTKLRTAFQSAVNESLFFLLNQATVCGYEDNEGKIL